MSGSENHNNSTQAQAGSRDPSARWSKRALGEISIIVSMVFFGGSFTGQRYAMVNGAAPITYNAGRFMVSTTLLLLFRPLLQQLMADVENEYSVNENVGNDNRSNNSNSNRNSSSGKYQSISQDDSTEADSHLQQSKESKGATNDYNNEVRELWIWGGVCGFSNFLGSVLQQISLVSISVAKCGFITGMYVVMVPLFEWFIPGHRESVNRISIVAAAFSMVGMYFLSGCVDDDNGCFGTSEGRGELLVFISVFCWVGSILGSDMGLERKVCPVSITCVDFVICTVMNLALAIYLEPEQWQYPFEGIRNSLGITVFVGFTEATAFLLSTYGQKEIDATRASLLMSLEAVSSAAAGFAFLGETLGGIEILGCVIMFLATLIPTLNDYYSEESKSNDEGEDDNNNDNSNSNNTRRCDETVESSSTDGYNTSGENRPLLLEKNKLTSESGGTHISKERAPLSLATGGLRVRSNSKDLEMMSITGRRSRGNSEL